MQTGRTGVRMICRIFAAVFLALGISPAADAGNPIALENVTVLTGNGDEFVTDATVLIRGGRIACVGPGSRCDVPEGTRRHDLGGRWLMPGLIDVHVHFSQTGFVDARPDALNWRDPQSYRETQAELRRHPERFQRAYLCSGVTGVFDVGGYPWTWDLRAGSETDARSPRIAAAGPLVSTYDHWLNVPAERQFLYTDSGDRARHHVDYLTANRTDAVKMWFIKAGEPSFAQMEKVALAAGKAADRSDTPFIVHATDLEEAKVALRAGAEMLVHSVQREVVDDEFLELLVESGAVYVPTLIVSRGYLDIHRAVLQGRAPSFRDPGGCVDDVTRKKIESLPELVASEGVKPPSPDDVQDRARRVSNLETNMRENLRKVVEAGGIVAAGTDAGNPMTLHGVSMVRELKAMHEAGIPVRDVMVMATRNGARALGREDELGTVEAGKLADLIVLGSDPTRDLENLRDIEYVIKGGTLMTQESLQAE